MMRSALLTLCLLGCTLDHGAPHGASAAVADDEDGGAEHGCYRACDAGSGGLIIVWEYS